MSHHLSSEERQRRRLSVSSPFPQELTDSQWRECLLVKFPTNNQCLALLI
ncbi:MAG: hypothetical protein GPJ22_12565 [Microcystis aeruginosa LL13-03]|nr:hypothetical protein [Microcystis aeruginosa LL13-03]